MPPPKRFLVLSAAALVVVAALLAISLLGGHRHRRGEDDGDGPPRSRRLLNWLDAFSSPPKVAEDDYNGYPYSVIIVSYHKTGVSPSRGTPCPS